MNSVLSQKIKKLSKAAMVISKICFVIYIVIAILVFILSIIMACLPDDYFKVELTKTTTGQITIDSDLPFDPRLGSLSIGEDTYYLSPSGDSLSMTTTITPNSLQIVFVIVCGVSLAILVPLRYSILLFKALYESETPFCDNVANNLLKVSYTTIPAYLISSFSLQITKFILVGSSIATHIDIMVVLVLLGLILLSTIIKWGINLQKESDETL